MHNKAWKEQIAQRLTNASAFAHFLGIDNITDAGILEAEKHFPMAVTPYYASLITKPYENDPIFLQCIPSKLELINPPWLTNDPLGELGCSHGQRLIHRYPDRALLLVSSECATYCRHCTRKRISSTTLPHISDQELEDACKYLKQHPEIDDVLISGGDPLLLDDDIIEHILTQIKEIKSVKAIRIATRTLVTLPLRFTHSLIEILSKAKPVFVNTQFNHPKEITPQALTAAAMLIDAGIPVANQFVLLKGINDTKECVEELCRTLYHNRIRPYYMFQCDLVKGVEHFRTPISTGIEIMDHLRGRLSGMAIPNFAVDIPGLSGKIELLPNYILEERENETILRDNRGRITSYPSPLKYIKQ